MPSIVTHPADSAFVQGTLTLPSDGMATVPVQWGESLAMNLLCLAMVICAIVELRRFVNVLPSILGCIFRYKEVITLSESSKLVRDRDAVAYVCVLPFCLVVARYGLWHPTFITGLAPVQEFLVIIGVFLSYVVLRSLLQLLIGRGHMSQKIFKAGNQSFRVYLILAACVTLATAGVMELLGQGDLLISNVLYWEIALIFTLFALRKSQIFHTGCSFFSTFLYLCALEILPAAAVVVPAIYF